MTPLEIVIDELIVRGLSPSEARVTATAIEQRLIDLGERSSASITARAEASRRLSPVDVASTSPAAVGEAVAGAVWNALSGGRP